MNDIEPILVLDIDDTFIHAFNYMKRAELQLPGFDPSQILCFTTMGIHCAVFKRPGVEASLQEMAKHYQLVLWTAGHHVYAETIVNWLDPENDIFSKRMYRTECTELSDRRIIKDFMKLNVDLPRGIDPR